VELRLLIELVRVRIQAGGRVSSSLMARIAARATFGELGSVKMHK
jgi:hypothetical protein